MIRPCDVCQKPYEAKRASSRYCGERCKKRAQRAPSPAPRLTAVPPLKSEPSEDGPLVQATLEVLQAAGRDQTPAGILAVLLARRLESSTMDTGSSIAALVREHRSVMTATLEDVKDPNDPLEQIRARRRQRMAEYERDRDGGEVAEVHQLHSHFPI